MCVQAPCALHGDMIAPPALLGAPKNYPGVTKIAQKGLFLGCISVFDQNSKEFLKNLKYFLGYGPIFGKKKCAKKGTKMGQNRGFGFLPILPHFTLILGQILGCGD